MKHISVFIVFLAFLGVKTSFAGEVTKIEHADVSNVANQDGPICPFHKSLPRANEKLESEDSDRTLANDDFTIEG